MNSPVVQQTTSFNSSAALGRRSGAARQCAVGGRGHENETRKVGAGSTRLPESSVGQLLYRGHKVLVDEIDRVLAPLAISAAQYMVVSRLAESKINYAADLCRDIACDTGGMARMLERLELKGLLNRVRSKIDRRTVNLTLTDRGRELLPILRARVDGVLKRLVRGLSVDEADQLEHLLKRVLANV